MVDIFFFFFLSFFLFECLRDDLKVLIGFGGNGRSQNFGTVTTKEKSRKTFISNGSVFLFSL